MPTEISDSAHENRESRMLSPNGTPGSGGVWETELILLSGLDRSELLMRLRDLRAFLESAPNTDLKDLAFTLNTRERLAPERLAIVAQSILDVQEKLSRAASRLADANCGQIRDVQGIYFSNQPLGVAGKLAMLFPGEGAPYLGMIGDLAGHFPEVAGVISQCDAMSRDQGNAPLSRFLEVPDEPDERSALDQELRGLGNTMFSVLMVDWAFSDLFSKLGVRPDAVAGHSAGELAALWFSGSLLGRPDLPRLRQTMDDLEADEGSAGTGSVLLAVGASRESNLELLAQVAADSGHPADTTPCFLAMDNCPHQSVVIGPPDAMDRVVETLRERQILHERLPFNRPYHTPLFESQMAPLAQMFDSMQFQVPQMLLYSCTTGKPFPREPDAIRELAMAHWIQPVEFSRMIRNMHDDGVRIFLELGPRGNLTSFVSDILRERDFLAVSGDVQRRSGITQLHHVLGQLFAHHVAMRLDHLYDRRHPRPIAWGKSPGKVASPTPPVASATAPSGGARVVNGFWHVMGEFLDLQEDVIKQYLQGTRNGSTPSRPKLGVPEDLFSIGGEVARPRESPVSVPCRQDVEHQLPLVDRIEKYIPGQELVVRRCLDLAEDRYGDHHTVGGREVSYVHPERNGQPVVPMTFSLEWMAEAGRLIVLDWVVTAIRNLRLARWLVFDEDFPHTIELAARLMKRDDRTAELEMRIFDLGFEPGSDRKGDLAAVAMVEMESRYPAPPPIDDFPLTGDRPCRIPLDVLYKNLFHGELFQGVMSLDRYGNEGIQAQIRVLPRNGLFRSNPDPQFVLDPVLMDVAMHPLAGWHLEQPDQSGRILLPYELGDIRIFGPRPTVGSEMTARGRIVHESARRFTHTVEVVGPNNRIWCTMEKLRYWRFYLPFGEFNFHGPKDDYFLSENWSEVVPGSDGETACCVGLVPPEDLQAPGMMLAAARVTLTEEELRAFRKLELPDARKSQWLFGRMAAKDAARILWRKRTGEGMVPADIAITPDANGRPVASPIGRERPANFPNVSIAHTEGVVAALGSLDHSPGIHIARPVTRDESFIQAAFDSAERELLAAGSPERDEMITRFSCAKKAVSKALGQGRLEDPRSLNVTQYDPTSGAVEICWSSPLVDRSARDQLLVVQTLRREDLIIATLLLAKSIPCPEVMTTSSGKSPAS